MAVSNKMDGAVTEMTALTQLAEGPKGARATAEMTRSAERTSSANSQR